MGRGRRLSVALGGCLFTLVFAPGHSGAAPSNRPFAIKRGSFHITASTYQAGAHADLTTSFDFAHKASVEEETYNDVKNTIVNLPAGFIGNNTAVPTCTDAQLATKNEFGFTQCPAASQVGVISLDLATGEPGLPPNRFTAPVYNMQSNTGVAATLGFSVGGDITQILPVSVRPSDTGITVTSPSIEGLDEPKHVVVTVWGVPASPLHNAQRGLASEEREPGKPIITNPGGQEVHIPIKPFLSNPTACAGVPLVATMTADSWEEPESWSEARTELSPIRGCERNPFDPSFEAQPTTTSAESPSGLNATLVVPQTYEDPESLATSELENTRVTLPEGITVNPSAGAGLGSCSPQQLERETAFSLPGEGCPPEAKIGSVEVETPLLNEKLTGAVYVATPYDNPFGEPSHPGGSLLALYVVARDAERGVIVKVAGKVEPSLETGRLVATFDHAPQAPFSRFLLKFRPGATAPLVSPPVCGSFSAQAELTPWSAPTEPRLVSSPPFAIEHGVREGPCPSGGVPPFSPMVVSGDLNGAAGSYSPFYLRITRQDGEQEITGFSTTLPPGLTGNLSGIPFCPEADIEAARAQTGAEAEEHPACPAASEVGHTIVGAGVGTVLAQTPGRVYLAGAYHGDPLSLVSVTSAKVGPFDLGTVVIRFGLKINRTTAQVEVDASGSEPIPHIIKGIVVHVREIHVYMTRERFTLNPTSCEPMRISNTITGGGANPANPADWAPVTVTSPFQAADCANLGFSPVFSVSTSGRTSRANGASLTTRVVYPAGSLGTQANVAYARVELPESLPSRLTTLQKACTAAQFAADPAGCPAASVVGHAVVHTPVLPVSLEGPAYFVSHGGEAFPNLVVVLQGFGLTINLVGDTFIHRGVTSSTFSSTPDVPFSRFELILGQGPHSALTAHGDLCTQNLVMPTRLGAQNGLAIVQNTPIEVEDCPDALYVIAKRVRGRTATLEVIVPAAGQLRASGTGISRATKVSSGRQTLTLRLTEHRAGRLRTHVTLTFTPTTGHHHRKLAKTTQITFR
jgi:hypothetical protein